MIRELALIAALTAQQNIASFDQSHLIGLKNGAVTTAASAQADACVAAFLDGKEATLSQGETLNINKVIYQTFDRDTCAEEAHIPNSNIKYCKKYGARQPMSAQILQMKSAATGRAVQLFCVTRGDSEQDAEAILSQSLRNLLELQYLD